MLDDPRPPTDAELAADLTRYFRGLMTSVGKEKHATYPDGAFGASVRSPAPGTYGGTVTTVDAFGDGRALTLHLDASSLACGSKTVVLVSLSPHVPGDPIYRALLAQRETFRCAP